MSLFQVQFKVEFYMGLEAMVEVLHPDTRPKEPEIEFLDDQDDVQPGSSSAVADHNSLCVVCWEGFSGIPLTVAKCHHRGNVTHCRAE